MYYRLASQKIILYTYTLYTISFIHVEGYHRHYFFMIEKNLTKTFSSIKLFKFLFRSPQISAGFFFYKSFRKPFKY